ncbi:MAG: hypothetical protein NTY47_06630 [Candidatus Omnitrophica bacterium]|nr:hypothetical protein [Candidatus Omnitrophota bacterium]
MNKARAIVLFLFLSNLIIGIVFINEGIFHHDSVVLAQATEKTCQSARLYPQIRGRYGSIIVNSMIYLLSFIAGKNADFSF